MKNKLLIAFALALMVPWAMRAQSLGEYTFATGTDATKWITLTAPDTILTPANPGSDGKASTLQNIGFNFPYAEEIYTQFSVNTDGNLRLGGTVTGTSGYTSPFGSSYCNTNAPKINAMGCDGYMLDTGAYRGCVLKENVVNAAGQSLLVVEFATSTYNTTSRQSLLRWQVHLYANGNIEIVYYSSQPAILPHVTRQCGLCVNNTDLWLVNASHVATHYNSAQSGTIAMDTWPDNNRYYTFTRPIDPCARPISFSITNVNANGFDVDGTDTNSNTSLYLVDVAIGTTFDTLIETSVLPATITDLTPNTHYTVSLAVVCTSGDTSRWVSTSVTTPCLSIATDDLPYTYDFEDATGSGASYAIDACWKRHTSTTTNYPYPSSSYAHSGTYGLYFYGYSTTYSYLTLPPFESDINDLFLSFWAYTTVTNAVTMYIGVMSNPDDLTTFDTVSTIRINESSMWQLYDVDFSAYSGNGSFITILCPMISSNSFYIDDVTVGLPPTCPRPTMVVQDTTLTTASSVTVTWHNNATTASEYVVEYGLKGFTPGTGTMVPATDTSITITGLQSGMPYSIYVMAVCGSDTSTVGMGTATTGCAALTAGDLPYIETFEAYGSGASYPINGCWRKGTSSTTAYPYPSSGVTAINGSLGLVFYGYKPSSASTTPIYSYAVMPPIDETLNMSNLMINMMAKRYATTTSYYSSYVIVGIADDPDSLDFTLPLDSIPGFTFIDTVDLTSTASSSIHEVEVSFADYTGTGRYVVFYVPIPALSGSNTYAYNYIYLDDITLMETPTCFRPTAVSVASVTSDGATINWTPDDRTTSPSGWTIEYGPTGFTPGTGTTTTATDTTVTLSSLNSATGYDVYVAANCGGTLSESRMTSFYTDAVPADLPYITGFEEDDDVDWIFINGGQTNYWMMGAASETNNALFITNNGTNNSYTITSTSNVFAYRTVSITDSGDYALTFDWKAGGESTYDYLRVFLVPDSLTITPGALNDISSTATPAGWINMGYYNDAVKLNLNTTWTSSLGVAHIAQNATGIYKLLCFWHNDASSGTQPPAVVDNIEMRMLTCPIPTDLVVDSLSYDAATLSWQADDEVSAWQIKVDTNEWVAVSDNPYTLTGLTPNTHYTVAVRTDCGDDVSFATNALSFATLRYCGENNENIIDTIGTGTSTSYMYTMYNYSTYPTGHTHAIYTVQELNNMGLQMNNRINAIKLHSGTTGGTIHDVKVYVAETTLEGYSSTAGNDTLPRSAMTLVYSGDLVVPASSWIEIPFASPFTYSGNNNLMVALCRDGSATSSVSFYYTSTSPEYLSAYGYRSSATTANNSCTRSYNRPNMVFDVCTEIPNCPRPANVTVANMTDTSLTITWDSAADSYQIFVSEASVDPDTVTDATYLSADSAHYTITGLTGSTTYYIYVRSDCGSIGTSEWSPEAIGTTACSPLPLPYTEDFESYSSGSSASISPCWYKGTNSTTAYPYPSTTAINGQRSLYFYAYHPSTASSTPYYSYAALPMFQDSINNLMINFNVRTYSSAYTYYTTCLVVGVMDNPNDITTFTPVDSISFPGAAASSVHGVEVMFDQYTGSGKYIAIYDAVPPIFGTSTYNYSYAYVDDIVVDRIPSCPRPNNVTIDNIGQTTATVHWNANENHASFDIEYGPQGFEHGTGITVTSSVDSVDLTALIPSTAYDVYVRGICSETDQSEWSFVQRFATLCGPIALPVTYDPDNYTTGTSSPLPNCWTRVNNATGTVNYYPYIYSSSSNTHTGSNTLYYYFTTSSGYASDELMAFPEIDVVNFPMTQNEIVFWAKASSPNKHLQVGIMTDPTDVTTFETVDSISLTTTSTEYTVNFSSYTGTGAYVALRGIMEGSSYYYLYIDDITIGVQSHCARSYDLTATGATQNSAVLSWTDTIGSTAWKVAYHPMGDTGWTEVNATSNPFTLTGLSPVTTYVYRVAPICADGQQADWSRETYAFSTSQIPATIPYSYDFESPAEWANWQTVSNNTVNWYRGNNAIGNTGYAMYLSADSGATHGWNLNSITNAAAYRDFDFGTTPTSVELSFRSLIGGSTDGNYDGITVMVVDPTVVVQSTSTGLTSPWGHVASVDVRMDTVWTNESILLDGLTGIKRLVFFHFNQSTASSHPYIDTADAIDDIAIALQPCPRPYDLAADPQASSAALSWVGPATDTYVVAHRVYGTAASTNIYDTVTGNNFLLTGLTPNTDYAYWVMHVCSITATDTLVSDWSNGLRFATPCLPTALPYYETFDSVPAVSYSTAGGQLPDCWTRYSNGTNDAYLPHVVGSGSYWYSVGSSHSLTMTSGSAAYGDTKIVALPPFDAPVSACGIQFSYRHESLNYGLLEIGYVTGDDLAATFHPLVAMPACTTMTQIDSTLLSAAPANAKRIALRWTHDASFYSVGIDNISVWSVSYTCDAPEITSDTVSETTASFSWTGESASYEVAIAQVWNEDSITGFPVTDTFYTFNGLTAGTSYTLGVRAVCGPTNMSDWTTVTITTDEHPCAVPTDLAFSDVTFNSATLSWTPGEAETEWDVHITGTNYDQTFTVTTNPYIATGLASGVEYTATVRSRCSATQQSDWSNPVTFTTATCQPVSNVTTSNATTTTVQVHWTAPAGVSNFDLEYGASGFAQGSGTHATATTNSITLSGLTPGTMYDVYVRSACGDNVYSSWSNVVSFETEDDGEGIEDVNSANIALYPNPATTTVTLTGFDGQATVTIVDMNGRAMGEYIATNNTLTIDLTGYAQGAYFVRITGEQVNAIRKLIVK